MEFREGHVIRNTDDGLEGVVIGFDLETGSTVVQIPFLGDELHVLIGPTDTFIGMGEYERQITQPEKCGIGQGVKTCIYLARALGQAGFTCARFSDIGLVIEQRLKEGYIGAKGKPISMRPGCQQEIQAFIEN